MLDRRFSRIGLPSRALLICAATQLIELLHHDFSTDAAGHALQGSPVNALMLQLPLYAAGLLVPAALWSSAYRLLPRWRRGWDVIGTCLAVLVLCLGVVDLGMQRLRGERWSLNHVAAYGTGSVLDSQWIRPVFESPMWAVFTLALLGAACVALVLSFRWRHAAERPGRDAVVYALLALAVWLPTQFAYYHQRDMARSPQSVLLSEVIDRATDSRPDDAVGRVVLRAFLEQGAPVRWLADSFPVWHRPPADASPSFGAAKADPPDIVLFEIESLRGRDVGWGFGGRVGANSPTPHLDSLAAQSVTFPHYIASGEPSPRGFITLQSGAWEHGNLFIVANRTSVVLDAIPLRLKGAGYHTVAFWGGNPGFDNQLTWGRRWYDDVVFERRENRLFYFRTTPDRELMDRVVERLDAHDRSRAAQPFFFFVATAGTHSPFTLEDSAAVTADTPPSRDRQRRYDLALRNADAQIARVIARLRARPRWRNTVIIVTGDHADRTTEPDDSRWRGMPTDAQVATAALIFGPPSLIGRPRTLTFTASHVDVLPTLSAWLGDTSATSTMGRDLFDASRASARQAVAINSRGYRLDRGGYTLMVDAKDPRVFSAWRSFTGEQPHVLPIDSTPFAADEAQHLYSAIKYWSAVVDANRVRPAPHR